MTQFLWPDPICASGGALTSAVRCLWAEASRVSVAASGARWLLRLVQDETEPSTVSVVTLEPAPLKRPAGWGWTTVATPPSPEFILFYSAGTSFPASALIFADSAGPTAWATVHRQPIVLDRLQQRFYGFVSRRRPRQEPLAVAPVSSRAAAPRDTGTVTSIREEPWTTDSAGAENSSHTLDGSETRPDSRQPELVPPGELYLQILTAHFARSPEQEHSRPPGPPPDVTPLAEHQERAYERARDTIERYGGVIVADAVGLGKTYVGLRLIERAMERGGSVLVIVPAAVKHQWNRELAQLSRTRSGEISLLSVESLGQHSFDPTPLLSADLVLVDEAHNFRNPATRRYRNLTDLTRNAPVVLLTATPINNSILDLQHLIELFAPPGAFRHLGVPDYRDVFGHARIGCGDVRRIVSACVVRRTRRFLREHYGEIHVRDPSTGRSRELRFPKRRPPVRVEYDLVGTYGGSFGLLWEWMEKLSFPHLSAEEHATTKPLAMACDLLKIILLKRMESSVQAFGRSVRQQLAWCDTALQALDAGRILTRLDYRDTFRGPPDDPGSQLAFVQLMLPEQPRTATQRMQHFRRLLSQDREVLDAIHRALGEIGPQADHKLTALRDLIDGPLAGSKVLIFTEFRDTARYIHHQLRGRPYLAQIDSSQARLGHQRATRSEVIERFAPQSNGLPDPPERERVELLIATDVLSEGLNLQDASAVISYDLPWNPVRLMQRYGRIDRLGAIVEWVELYHFTPAEELERLLGLMRRLREKIFTITTTLGIDEPLFAPPDGHNTESTRRILQLAQVPESFESVERELEGPMDPEEQAYIDYAAALADGTIAGIQTCSRGNQDVHPLVSVVAGGTAETGKAIAYWQIKSGNQSRALWLVYDFASHSVLEDLGKALAALERARSSPQEPAPDVFLETARIAFRRYVDEVVARLEASRIAGDALTPNLPQCRIAAWLSRYFAASRSRMDAGERATIDDLLGRLTRRLTSAGERALAQLADALPEQPDSKFLERLDRELRSLGSDLAAEITVREVGTLLLLRA